MKLSLLLTLVVISLFSQISLSAAEPVAKAKFEKVEVFADRVVFTLPLEYETMPDKEWDKIIPLLSAYVMLNKEKDEIFDGAFTIHRKGRFATLIRK